MKLARKSLATLSLLVLLSANASAALITSTGPVANLRIEGNAGFIGLTQSMAGFSTCGTRVWVDMTSSLGRAIYATAMMAFTTKQSVIIRAAEEFPRVFGECQLYDIYVPQS